MCVLIHVFKICNSSTNFKKLVHTTFIILYDLIIILNRQFYGKNDHIYLIVIRCRREVRLGISTNALDIKPREFVTS